MFWSREESQRMHGSVHDEKANHPWHRVGQIWKLDYWRPSNFMGLTEGPSEANSLPRFYHLLTQVSSDFLPVCNGGSMPCKFMVHQLKRISWDINDTWPRVKSLGNRSHFFCLIHRIKDYYCISNDYSCHWNASGREN